MFIISILIIVLIPLLAQGIRYLVDLYTQTGTKTLIPYILDLSPAENRGVAFGLFQNSTVFFAIVTSVVIIVLFILLIKNYKNSKLFSVAAALIIGGGAANLFERVAYGYVFDYLQLSFFPPICNFADYCITAGTVLLIIYLLFFYKDKSKKAVPSDHE